MDNIKPIPTEAYQEAINYTLKNLIMELDMYLSKKTYVKQWEQ